MGPVGFLDDRERDLLIQGFQVDSLEGAGVDQTIAQMNDLGPLFLQAKGPFQDLVGLITAAASATVKSNEFNRLISLELSGPVLQRRETVKPGALIAVFLATDNTNLHL